MVLDWEVVHFGNPGYDVGQMLTHLILKAAAFPQWGARYFATSLAFWEGYREMTSERITATVSDEAVLQIGALLLARLDGKSPVDYLTEPAARDSISVLGTRLLRERPASIEEAWPLIQSILTKESSSD